MGAGMKSREEFITLLAEQIRCRRAREDVIREIEAHISDQAQEYEAAGMTPEEALSEAVEQMGDPVSVGVELDRIHRPRMDWGMIAMAVLFSLGGLFVQCAVGMLSVGGDAFGRQCLFMGLGFCLMLGVCFLDYSFIGKYAKPLYLLFAVGMLFYMTQFSYTVNGMHRGAILPMYLFVPLYAGILYQYRKTGYGGLGKCVLFLIPPVWIAWYGIPSISVGFQLFLICAGMLLLAVFRGWFGEKGKRALPALLAVGILLPLAGAAAGWLFFLADYQKMRIAAFLNPGTYADGAGYIYLRAADLLEQVKWFAGVENGRMLLEQMPGSDLSLFSFVVLYGAFAGLLVIAALAVLVVDAFLVSLKQKNQLGLMIGMGCTLVLGVQAVIGAAVNFGSLPATTVTLPFLTGGGSAVLVYDILIGLLLSVSRNRDVLSDRMYRPGWRLRLERLENPQKSRE